MINIKKFVFNPFEVNTYVIWDETKECAIIDPGCSSEAEQEEISQFIKEEGLKPLKLLNTHSHIDHIAGNSYISKTYKLKLQAGKDGAQFIDNSVKTAEIYGFGTIEPVYPELDLHEGDVIRFGKSELEVIETGGHADGSFCFISREGEFVVSGDVLFYQTIGRTDLPTGDYKLLIQNIKDKLLTLPKNYTVYSGHGPKTTIGFEMAANPFLAELGF
jgi:hydroxyacylglutathione hydrolase